MDISFWQERWQRGEIGFHLPRPHPKLVSLWPALVPNQAETVFVPLCGKSLDLNWLLGRGHPVIAVEASELAVQQFFAEQALTPEVDVSGPFTVYRFQQLSLYCGDFFDLTMTQLTGCGLIYDRAALIALPPAMRKPYVAHMRSLFPQANMLLLTLVYPQAQMSGPPFAVTPEEVAGHYPDAERQLLLDQDILMHESRFASRGVTSLHEQAWHVRW